MTDVWLKRWNDRFREDAYAYGTEANEFLKAQILKLKAGSILFGAEGEGRNSVYAATQGWQVSAFDISEEGKNKALKLADEHNVNIDYQVGLLPGLTFANETFDAIALIYAHFPPRIRSDYHRLLSTKLKKGGTVIVEAFGKNHPEYQEQNPKIGGPRDLESLISTKELEADFKDYEILELAEKEVTLSEGLYHNGVGSVTRFVAKKRS